ncbi:MAG: D-alanyl-D-alanine carboxypeptidase/D-alanyl-D-alanine-endopeptidase, partial [Pyrinomonadaceae bacterium]|nr:D-alanyl-D-alanine carboxypeptidase/D-alanyl-D-alanine-endopeptidase [Pyrinomonadaceae bacterium]
HTLFAILALCAMVSAQDPTPTPESDKQVQTVSYLKSRIAMRIADPGLKRGRVGVKIVSARDGRTIYERNAEDYFIPASNMKSFTVAAAIENLSPSFRFKTSIYSQSGPDSNGAILGDLIVYGRGDPSFSEAFSEGEPYKRIDELVDAIVGAGVKSVSGSLVADETYFSSKAIPNGWEWDDLQWYYGAEISPLTIFDNTIELNVGPSTVGQKCVVQTRPLSGIVRIVNTTMTTTSREKRKLRVTKLLGQNVIEVAGTMPENGRPFKGRVAVTNPAELFAEVLAKRLRLKGVQIRVGTKAIDLQGRSGTRLPVDSYTEVASVYSPPLSIIAAKTMKPSQNLYTELLLRALGESSRIDDDSEAASDKLGMDAVQDLLRKAGVAPRSVIQYDGSGLSRHNLITPDSAVKLYQYMNQSRNGLIWRNSLTIGGLDGTLRNRFKGTSAQGNVRGKTGTLDQVSALSGYVTSKSGEKFVFSILTNNIPSSGLRRMTIDDIVKLLADYDGTL